jgi:RNA polymerase sigma factor for flagellar operon FliA
MSLNQGIQKYRESARASSSKSKSKPESKAEAKKEEKKPVKASSPSKAVLAKSPAPTKAPAKAAKKSGALAATKEVETAIAEAAAAEEAAREEAALQKEIAEELEREAAHTNALVKEDFSPVNSSRDKLILEYAPLIKYIAQKIAARLPANIELDDLISSGVIGLMDAIEKYDATRDNKFKTYAEFRIRGAILDELRAQDWVPRSVREKAKTLERCYSKIEHQKGRQATDEEVCEELGITQEEFHDMLNQVRSVSLLSYDDISNFSKSDKRFLHGYGEAGGKAPTPFNEVNVAHIKHMIAEAIHDLPEKQRLVLSLYYYEDLNLKEIGRVLDVTESRVSQLHTQAILRLKAKLRNNWDEFLTLFG